ncbi:hypothetical protein K3495_g489 [Podosphaera aphanis]|nr:hypothetical protein K3495_g489 [Podosphaera aphanis]
MSSRRLNRTSSRAASSHRDSTSDFMTEFSSSTPQISYRRLENHVLPSVETKPSCAYGANSLAQPRRTVGPQSTEKLTSVLHDILDPRIKVSSPNTRTQSPVTIPTRRESSYCESISERSFDIESTVYREASIESSIIDLTESSGIPEDFSEDSENVIDEVAYPMNYLARQEHQEHQESENFALQEIGSPHIHQTQRSNFFSRINKVDKIRSIIRHLPSIWLFVGVPLVAMFLWTFLNEPSISAIVSYLPDTRPTIFFADEATIIRQRLGKLESDISRVKKRMLDVDFNAVKKLQLILPDNIVLKKKDGVSQISDDLWKEILARIKSDDFFREIASSGREKMGSNVTIPSNQGSKFSRENEVKLGQLYNKNLTRQFPQLLQDYEIISKTEVINLIAENWEVHRIKIFSELKALALELEHSILREAKSQISKMRQQEIKALAAEVVKRLPDAQLQATARVNIQKGISYDNMKPNHFSKTLGAIIDRRTTSPTYAFPSYAGTGIFERIMRGIINNPVPTSHGPETALKKWEEQGECWCVALDGQGFGPSLGVAIGNKIFPEEVVVEHIPSTLTMEPGSIPKDFELLALIEDPKMESVIENESKRFFPEDSYGPVKKMKGYVRIAAWVYEANSTSHIQKYEIPLNLKAFGVDTSRLIIRVISNWGGGDVDYTCLYRVRLHGSISQPDGASK